MRGRAPTEDERHARQDQITAFLRDYRIDHGYPPSRREIVAAVPGLSLGVLADELERLALDGRLVVAPGTARGIVVVR